MNGVAEKQSPMRATCRNNITRLCAGLLMTLVTKRDTAVGGDQ
jgi:hypothetical protein